jgi:hypothetical protein
LLCSTLKLQYVRYTKVYKLCRLHNNILYLKTEYCCVVGIPYIRLHILFMTHNRVHTIKIAISQILLTVNFCYYWFWSFKCLDQRFRVLICSPFAQVFSTLVTRIIPSNLYECFRNTFLLNVTVPADCDSGRGSQIFSTNQERYSDVLEVLVILFADYIGCAV